MAHTRQLDAAALKALAHPLRVEMFTALRKAPATATQLAERFGHNTGTVSWHLRHLAKFGLIEDAPGHGDGRERWWRATAERTRLNVLEDDIVGDPAAMQAARRYVSDSTQRLWQALQRWIDTAEEWDAEWIAASTLSDALMELTPEEATALHEDLLEVFDRHRWPRGSNPDPRARLVQVGAQVFPKEERR